MNFDLNISVASKNNSQIDYFYWFVLETNNLFCFCFKDHNNEIRWGVFFLINKFFEKIYIFSDYCLATFLSQQHDGNTNQYNDLFLYTDFLFFVNNNFEKEKTT